MSISLRFSIQARLFWERKCSHFPLRVYTQRVSIPSAPDVYNAHEIHFLIPITQIPRPTQRRKAKHLHLLPKVPENLYTGQMLLKKRTIGRDVFCRIKAVGTGRMEFMCPAS
jgi:hypothetical protein